MNKYQEALDKLKNVESYIEPYATLTGIEFDINEKYGIELNKLQELVDKATPMKPLHVNLLSNPPRNIIVCGNCAASNLGKLFKYCSNCGQKIDWRYEE